MQAEEKNIFFFWIQLIFLLLTLVILQNSLLPLFMKPFLIPYLLWIPLFYFLLYKSFFESLSLLILVSLFSCVFLSLPLPTLFFIYLSGFILFLILKKIFLLRSLQSFFALVFLFSFYFSFLIEKAALLESASLSGFSLSAFLPQNSYQVLGWDQILYYSSKSFMTSFLSLLPLLFFKKTFYKKIKRAKL